MQGRFVAFSGGVKWDHLLQMDKMIDSIFRESVIYEKVTKVI